MKNWIYTIGIVCFASSVLLCYAICFRDLAERQPAVLQEIAGLWALIVVGLVCVVPKFIRLERLATRQRG